MKYSSVLTIAVLLLAVSPSLAQQKQTAEVRELTAGQTESAPRKNPTTNRPAWQLSYKTSGGFMGQNSGTLVLDSEGNVALKRTARLTCKDHLSSEELLNIDQAMSSSNPSDWAEKLAGKQTPSGRDLIETTLELQFCDADGSRRFHRATWDSKTKFLPQDLQELSRFASDLRNQVLRKCKTIP
jgi:hypothetical protein